MRALTEIVADVLWLVKELEQLMAEMKEAFGLASATSDTAPPKLSVAERCRRYRQNLATKRLNADTQKVSNDTQNDTARHAKRHAKVSEKVSPRVGHVSQVSPVPPSNVSYINTNIKNSSLKDSDSSISKKSKNIKDLDCTRRPQRAREAVPESQLESEFSAFWAAYPSCRRINKQAAKRHFFRVRRHGVACQTIMNGVSNYVSFVSEKVSDPCYVKGPDVWLNKGCWEDELPMNEPSSPAAQKPSPLLQHVLDLEAREQRESEPTTAGKLPWSTPRIEQIWPPVDGTEPLASQEEFLQRRGIQ